MCNVNPTCLAGWASLLNQTMLRALSTSRSRSRRAYQRLAGESATLSLFGGEVAESASSSIWFNKIDTQGSDEAFQKDVQVLLTAAVRRKQQLNQNFPGMLI